MAATAVASSLDILSLPSAATNPAAAHRLAAAAAIVVDSRLPVQARWHELREAAGTLLAVLTEALLIVLFAARDVGEQAHAAGRALRAVACRRGAVSGYLRHAVDCMDKAVEEGITGIVPYLL